MSKPVYRADPAFVHDLAVAAARAKTGDDIGLCWRQKVMARALRYNATARQRECIYLYYSMGLAQADIGKQLKIDITTVSRNIKHGLRWVYKALEKNGD